MEPTYWLTPPGDVAIDMEKNTPKHQRFCLARRTRLSAAMAAALAGGSLLGTCEMRFRDAIVDTSKNLLCTTVGTTILGPDGASAIGGICR